MNLGIFYVTVLTSPPLATEEGRISALGEIGLAEVVFAVARLTAVVVLVGVTEDFEAVEI